MIPAMRLSKNEFQMKFLPGGNRTVRPQATFMPAEGRDVITSKHHPILNDIPPTATSCLIYNYSELKSYSGDSTYPIPGIDEFKNFRELKSLQAVVKQLSDGNTVFSHMFVDPHDVLRLLGWEFMNELRDIQRDVNRTLLIANHRSLEMGISGSHLKSILA